jgi:para-nitrobenzyl esterase
VVDGHILPSHPFDPTAPSISSHKSLMVGWNEDEYTFFAWQRGDVSAFKLDFAELPGKLELQLGADAQRIVDTYRQTMPDASAPEIFVAISSIMMMGLGSIEIAEKKAIQGGAPVYLYNFGYKSEENIPGTDYALGTPHAMDISFKFNNQTPASPPDVLAGSNPDRFVASRQMAELWTTFARTGVPAAAGVPKWPAYTLADRATMRIDTNCQVLYDRFKEELAAWRAIGVLS